MPYMAVTEDVFQSPIAWSKAEAPSNICAIPVTEEVFQFPIGWLKEEAL